MLSLRTPTQDSLVSKASEKIRSFLLKLFAPIRASISVNVQILQSSVLLRHRIFFRFLRVHCATAAAEVQRAYAVSIRNYYETAFRRYIRSLTVLVNKQTPAHHFLDTKFATSVEQDASKVTLDMSNLNLRSHILDDDEKKKPAYSSVKGEAVVLAYQTALPDYHKPIEASFRSALIALLDNAAAEFAFCARFLFSDAESPEDDQATTSLFASEGDHLEPEDQKALISLCRQILQPCIAMVEVRWVERFVQSN